MLIDLEELLRSEAFTHTLKAGKSLPEHHEGTLLCGICDGDEVEKNDVNIFESGLRLSVILLTNNACNDSSHVK